MHLSSSAPLPPIASEWHRRRRLLLNRCLAGAALLVLAALGATLWLRPSVAPSVIMAVFVAALAWLATAYALGYWRQIGLAGSALVMLSITVLALAAYLFHASAALLLPLVVVPVALAALLLTPTAVYVTALGALVAVIGALVCADLAPPPAIVPVFTELPPLTGAVVVAAVTLLLVALLVAPVRGAVYELRRRAERDDALRAAMEQHRLIAEGGRDDALEQLTRTRQLVTLLAEQSSDGLLTVAADGSITAANETASQLWTSVGSGDLVGAPLNRVQALLEDPAATRRVATLAALPSGKTVPHGSYTHVLRDQREQARFARLRGELLGLLTDEMRNPLTSMLTALDLTLGQNNLPEETDRVLIGARRSGQRLIDLVTLLLEISQIEQDPATLQRTPLALRRVIESGLAQLAPLAQQSAITITMEYGADQPIVADPERLRRAFVYLMEHALRRSPPYATIQVRTELQSGALLVRITDQGPTLSTTDRAALFERRDGGDRGGAITLGMAFAQLVIERHGGRVWAEVNGSHGNSLVVTLPTA